MSKKYPLTAYIVIISLLMGIAAFPCYVCADEIPVSDEDVLSGDVLLCEDDGDPEVLNASEDLIISDNQTVSADPLLLEDSPTLVYDAVEGTQTGDDDTVQLLLSDNNVGETDKTDTSGASDEDSYIAKGYIHTELAYDVPVIGSGQKLRRRSVIPSSYNAYYDGTLPQGMHEIRNQDPYGTCWAFSALGAVETDLLHDGTNIDLSELQLVYYATHNYSDPKGCRSDFVTDRSGNAVGWLDNGGNEYLAYRCLSNLIGAVTEADVPYTNATTFSPNDSYIVSRDYAQIRNAYIINVTDRNGIKSAVLDHGGVTAAYYDNSRYYNATYNSYCGTIQSANHAGMIVGWDDDFSRDKFTNKPSSDGAWLVRNSWGYNGYGRSGYFWMSYEDSGFIYNGQVVAFDTSSDVYENCYAYDGQPVYDTIRYVSPSQAVSQIYNVSAGEELKAVGFELGSANVSAEITVTDQNTESSVSQTAKTTYAGFYTVEMPQMYFADDSEIEVSIRYTADSGKSVEVVCEEVINNGWFGDLYLTGVCDGGCTIGGNKQSVDARMKLYTNNADTPGDPVEAFVTRLYWGALDREPDSGGLSNWVDALKSGRLTGADVVRGFYLSREMLAHNYSNSAYVEHCYKGMLGRSSDTSKKEQWVSCLDAGVSYTCIIKGFADSQEFTDLCRQYGINRGSINVTEARDKNAGITQYVSRLYIKALDRKYDINGLNNWCASINNDPSRANVLRVATNGFLHSQEFRNRNLSDGEYVKVLYRTFLGREYDQKGYDYWVNQLKNGKSRDDIVNGFAYSQEFNDIMAQYGL